MGFFRQVQKVSEGRHISVFGDGTRSRDFTFWDDMARGTIAALRPVGYDTINLGSDETVVLNDAIRLIERLTGHAAQVEYPPAHLADVKASWADISRAGQALQWEPQLGFDTGVQALIDWCQAKRAWAGQIETGR